MSIRLLSTDFDGTLIAMGSRSRCSANFAAALENHSRSGGLWAINTGRSLGHTIEGLELFQAPIWPDFLLTNERDIYRRIRGGHWEPHGDWNTLCHRRHQDLFKDAIEMLSLLERFAQASDHITILYEDGIPAGLVTQSEEQMQAVADYIQSEGKRPPDFSFQRNSVYLRFCHRDYHKGSALGELCRLEGLDACEVLAAGDHFNDLSMLDGLYAKMTACPANAIEPVKELVRSAQGYVARSCWADGVAEALFFYGGGPRSERLQTELWGELGLMRPV